MSDPPLSDAGSTVVYAVPPAIQRAGPKCSGANSREAYSRRSMSAAAAGTCAVSGAAMIPPTVTTTNTARRIMRSLVLAQLADPDVAIAYGMAVILQQQRQPVGMRCVMGALPVHRPAGDDRVVLDEHAVVQHRHPRRVAHGAVRCEAGPVKNDVVGLPLARRAARIDERGGLSVDGGGLAVGVRVAVIGIEHLNLIVRHHEDAAVAAILALARGRHRRRPFDVQLDVAEAALRHDRPRVWRHLEVTVSHDPFRRRAVLGLPLCEALAVEQHDRIRRWRHRWTLRAGIDDGRAGALERMDWPLLRAYRSGQESSNQQECGVRNSECGM